MWLPFLKQQQRSIGRGHPYLNVSEGNAKLGKHETKVKKYVKSLSAVSTGSSSSSFTKQLYTVRVSFKYFEYIFHLYF